MSRRKKLIETAPVRASVSPSRRPSTSMLLPYAALVCLTLVAYANALFTGFALDSRMLVLGDPRIRQLNASTLGSIFQHTYWWPNGEAGLYRPLTTFSYLFNYTILGNAENPAGYHVLNVLLHVANVLLVFRLARKLLAGWASLQTCVVIAALWAVHPVLTESVTNVAGRADLLAALGVLCGLLMYIQACETIGAPRVWWLVGLGVSTGLCVLSKENGVILPALLVLYELSVRADTKPARTAGRRMLLWGICATLPAIAIMAALRTLALSKSSPAEWPYVDNPIVGASFWTGRLTVIHVLARYLKLAFWPWTLSSDYSYAQIPLARGNMSDWLAWGALAVTIALTAVFSRRNKAVLFFSSVAFLGLLPASNLLFPIGTVMAERLLYLPLIGFVAVFVLAAEKFAANWKISAPVVVSFFVVLAAAFCVRTIMRNPDWTSDRTMAEAGVLSSPESFKMHRLLAAEILQTDSSPTGVARAVHEADRSVSILSKLPDKWSIPEPWTLAANCHLAQGNLLTGDRAKSEFETAVKLADRSIEIARASHAAFCSRGGGAPIEPENADANRIIAAASLRLNQSQSALQSALKARQLEPNNPDTYRQIAEAYLGQQKAEEAAITLAEGAFATGSEELRGDLIRLYEQSDLDGQKCAVVAGPRGPALNSNCELVRRDLCEATTRAHRLDLRKQLSCPN